MNLNCNVWEMEERFDKILINQIWPEHGIEIICKYVNKPDQERKGDYRISYNNREYNVDNKVEYDTPQNFPIELIQDVLSENMGWFYKLKECDLIFYGVFNADWTMRYIYSINFHRLREYNFANGWLKYNNGKGRFGLTVFWAAPLIHLVNLKIARQFHIEMENKNKRMLFPELGI